MIEWELTKGQWALIDLEDWPKIEQYSWQAKWQSASKTYYAKAGIAINRKWTSIQMSRLVMGLQHSDRRQVDHINHNTLDNRKENLRIVTNQQNQQNRKNVKGCSWNKRDQNWRVKIKVNYKTIDLGSYSTEEQAHQAYLNARRKYGFIETV